MGILSNFFRNNNIGGSAAIGIDAYDSPCVLEAITVLNKRTAFPGIMELRWVKQMPATLGFTRFPITGVPELDGSKSLMTRRYFQRVWNRLEALGQNQLYPHRRPRSAAVWGQSCGCVVIRSQAPAGCPTRAVFTNEFMEQCSLTRTPGSYSLETTDLLI